MTPPRRRRASSPLPLILAVSLSDAQYRLSIKSEAVSTASGTTLNQKPAYAVLCTPTRTFQLRQVQTSNSVFITQVDSETHISTTSAPGIAAVASCKATLELHPSAESAVVYLRQVLPLYDIIDGNVNLSGNGKSRDDIFADIPLSAGECQKGWNELIAFESSGSSFRPTANTLIQVWSAMHSAALVEGIKLGSQFLIRDLLGAMDEEAYPVSLISAILRHLGTADQVEGEAWSCLDSRKTVIFVGRTLLEAKLGDEYLTAAFLDDWKNALPEAWREEAELDTIKGSYHLPSSTTIAFGSPPAASAPTTTSTRKGKWHEKFAKARKK